VPITQATLDRIQADLFREEGGLVDDPDDAGGLTNLGMTLHAAQALGLRLDVNGDGVVDGADVRAFTRAEVWPVYLDQYVQRPSFHQLPDLLAPLIVDVGVNSGQGAGVLLLQEVLNDALAASPGRLAFAALDEDGRRFPRCGPRTLAAAAEAAAAMGPFLVNALVEHRVADYRAMVARRPANARFLGGWTRRANSYRLPTPPAA
jgi:lysozyme family protein